MKKAAILILILFGSSSAWSQDQKEDCRVPGTPAQWVAAYCRAKTESDDADSPLVQKCLIEAIKDKAIEKFKMSECEQKIYRKKQICAIFSPDSEQQHKCSTDPKFVPLVVQQGLQGIE